MTKSLAVTPNRVRLNVQAVARPHSKRLSPQPDCSIYRSLLGHLDRPAYWQRDVMRAPVRHASGIQLPLHPTARSLAKGLKDYIDAESSFAEAIDKEGKANDVVWRAHKGVKKAIADLLWLLKSYPEQASHPPRALLDAAVVAAIPMRLQELEGPLAIPLPPALESRHSAFENFGNAVARQHRGHLSAGALTWINTMQKRWTAYMDAETKLVDARQADPDAAFTDLCEALWAAQDQLRIFEPLAFVSVANGYGWKATATWAMKLLQLSETLLQIDKRYKPRPLRPTAAEQGRAWTSSFAKIQTFKGQQPKPEAFFERSDS